MARSDVLSRPWAVLAGLAEPEFEFEKELSLFQIRFWLTGSYTMRPAFLDAGVWYGLYRMQQGFQLYGQATASWRMRELFKNPSYRKTFSRCFTRGYLQRIFEATGFQDEIVNRSARWRWVEFEIEFAKARLALAIQQGDRRLGSAEIYHEARKPGVIGISVAERDRSFKDRAAYLVAAEWTMPALLSFGDDALSGLTDRIPDTETFQLFCAQVRAVAEILDCSGAKQIETWTGITGSGIPDLPPVPADTLNKLLKPQPRSGGETSVGKAGRQKPL